MYNTTKMNLYRLIKSKSSYIILFITAAMMIFSTYMLSIEQVINSDINSKIESHLADTSEDTQVDIRLGINVASVSTNEEITIFEFLYVNLQSGFIILFLSIFTVLFVSTESSTGYIKNISNHVKDRKLLIVSKFVTLCFYTILLFIAATIGVTIGSFFFYGYIHFGFSPDALCFIGVQLLLHIAFASFAILICTILRNAALSMGICIMASLGSFGLLLLYLDSFLKNTLNINNISLSKLDLLNNISTLQPTYDTTVYNNALFTSFGFILICGIISMYVFQKKDI